MADTIRDVATRWALQDRRGKWKTLERPELLDQVQRALHDQERSVQSRAAVGERRLGAARNIAQSQDKLNSYLRSIKEQVQAEAEYARRRLEREKHAWQARGRQIEETGRRAPGAEAGVGSRDNSAIRHFKSALAQYAGGASDPNTIETLNHINGGHNGVPAGITGNQAREGRQYLEQISRNQLAFFGSPRQRPRSGSGRIKANYRIPPNGSSVSGETVVANCEATIEKLGADCERFQQQMVSLLTRLVENHTRSQTAIRELEARVQDQDNAIQARS